MNRIKCFSPGCNADMASKATLYRINAKGQVGIWACKKHLPHTDAPRDPELEKIVNIIANER